MPFKLVEVECRTCGETYEVLCAPGDFSPGDAPTPAPDDLRDCALLESGKCAGPFEVVLSVAAHGKHSSWAVK